MVSRDDLLSLHIEDREGVHRANFTGLTEPGGVHGSGIEEDCHALVKVLCQEYIDFTSL